MKIDFSKGIFTGEYRVRFDGRAGWAKRWILSNLDVSVNKRRQQGGSIMMIWDGSVKQTVTEPFQVNEGVKMNSAKYCYFMDKTFFVW